MRFGRDLGCAWLILLAGGCATLPPVAEPVRAVEALTSVDGAARRLAFERRHGGCTPDADTAILEQIVQRIAGATDRHVCLSAGVLRSEEPNAYVLATGHVYVTAGLLEMICSEDELAAVIAHEIAHLDDPEGFGREQDTPDARLTVEVNADRRAVPLLVNAGYDARALGIMILRLDHQQPEGWAAHRFAKVREWVNSTSPVAPHAPVTVARSDN